MLFFFVILVNYMVDQLFVSVRACVCVCVRKEVVGCVGVGMAFNVHNILHFIFAKYFELCIL